MQLETTYLVRKTPGQTRALAALLASPLLIGLSALSESLIGGTAAGVAMLASVAMLVVSGIVLTTLNRGKRGQVVVDDVSVSLDGVRFARADLSSAHFTAAVGSQPACVHLMGKGESEVAWIGVGDRVTADRLIAELGLGADKTTSRFYALAKLGSPSGWGMMGAIAFAAFVGMLAAALHTPALVAVSVVALIAGSAYFLPAQIHLGADGLLYKTRLNPRFVPWADIEDVLPSARGISLKLRNGQTEDLPTTQNAKMFYEHEKVAQAGLVSRAQELLAAFRGGAVPDVTTRVERRGSTKDEWLGRLFDREGSFREAPLRSEDLWKVVESPAASHTARAGAAAVLAREASGEDRVRLRVAAEACAEPRLRVVLDKAGGGAAADELLAALDEVEDERAAEA